MSNAVSEFPMSEDESGKGITMHATSPAGAKKHSKIEIAEEEQCSQIAWNIYIYIPQIQQCEMYENKLSAASEIQLAFPICKLVREMCILIILS